MHCSSSIYARSSLNASFIKQVYFLQVRHFQDHSFRINTHSESWYRGCADTCVESTQVYCCNHTDFCNTEDNHIHPYNHAKVLQTTVVISLLSFCVILLICGAVYWLKCRNRNKARRDSICSACQKDRTVLLTSSEHHTCNQTNTSHVNTWILSQNVQTERPNSFQPLRT